MRGDKDVCYSQNTRDCQTNDPPRMERRKGYENNVFDQRRAIILVTKRTGVSPKPRAVHV